MKRHLLAALAAAIALPCAAQAATPISTEVEIAGPLKGTLLKPAGVKRPPVVVILAGSGPTDRDGNNPMGVKGASYRLLAEGLAAQGIASVRVDKRGLFASGAAAAHPAVQDFLINVFAKDPALLVATYRGPVLIVQGSTDLQTTVQDAQALKRARPEAKLVVLEGVNHLLKDAPADRASNFATYGNPDLPLNSAVVPTLAGFIKAHPGTN